MFLVEFVYNDDMEKSKAKKSDVGGVKFCIPVSHSSSVNFLAIKYDGGDGFFFRVYFGAEWKVDYLVYLY